MRSHQDGAAVLPVYEPDSFIESCSRGEKLVKRKLISHYGFHYKFQMVQDVSRSTVSFQRNAKFTLL
jgi:hypothetical protein